LGEHNYQIQAAEIEAAVLTSDATMKQRVKTPTIRDVLGHGDIL
jgi:hypothetical protein